MTIETKYNIGDLAYFKDKHGILKLTIREIQVVGAKVDSKLYWTVSYLAETRPSSFIYGEYNLFPSPELLIESLRKSYESELAALLATVNTWTATIMTVETKYNIGDTVYCSDRAGIEALTIRQIRIQSDENNHNPKLFAVYLAIGRGQSLFTEDTLFESPKLLIESIRQAHESDRKTLLATVNPE